MEGPAGVLALVLAETAAGGTLFLWLTPLWGRVRDGFFTLTAAILAVLALSAAGATASARLPGASTAPQVLLLVLTGTLALSAVAIVLRRRGIARVLGMVSAAVGGATLFELIPFGSMSGTWYTAFQLVAGAAFMGAVLDGLLLGHWYLVDRRLSREPINLFAIALLAAVAVETVAVVLQGFGAVEGGGRFSSLLGAAGVASYLAIGMVLATGLVAVMIRLTLRGERPSAVQAATGFFYLAVIFAVAGEFAAKIRFLPP